MTLPIISASIIPAVTVVPPINDTVARLSGSVDTPPLSPIWSTTTEPAALLKVIEFNLSASVIRPKDILSVAVTDTVAKTASFNTSSMVTLSEALTVTLVSNSEPARMSSKVMSLTALIVNEVPAVTLMSLCAVLPTISAKSSVSAVILVVTICPSWAVFTSIVDVPSAAVNATSIASTSAAAAVVLEFAFTTTLEPATKPAKSTESFATALVVNITALSELETVVFAPVVASKLIFSTPTNVKL